MGQEVYWAIYSTPSVYIPLAALSLLLPPARLRMYTSQIIVKRDYLLLCLTDRAGESVCAPVRENGWGEEEKDRKTSPS